MRMDILDTDLCDPEDCFSKGVKLILSKIKFISLTRSGSLIMG